MKKAIGDPETMNLHFVVPLTTTLASGSSSGAQPGAAGGLEGSLPGGGTKVRRA